jgi:hypothetical protein
MRPRGEVIFTESTGSAARSAGVDAKCKMENAKMQNANVALFSADPLLGALCILDSEFGFQS